uniref:ABC transporter domain-containing protein n=1 Tax=Octactis speculum TaxID=3111310 RepID=A0A7S2ARV0_9STRA
MPQDEMFLEQLCPREHLNFMTQLRLHSWDKEKQQCRVEKVIQEMKLEGVADSMIGNQAAEAGLTRNERKRLNFATETLTEPSLLYVDEPTTGLDSVMAANVVDILKRMAVGSDEYPQKRTVICTIHQPSTEIYTTFDKLYFIVDGRAAFFGPTRDVADYFARLGHPMPESNSNPADFAMELFVDPSNRVAAAARRQRLCDAYTTTLKPPDSYSDAHTTFTAKVAAVTSASWVVQFRVLLARDYVMRSRMPILSIAVVVRNAVLGLLMGLVLMGNDMSQTYVYSVTGSLFFGIAAQIMPTAICHIATLPQQLPCVIREIRSNGYSAAPYFLAKFLADIPIDLVASLTFSSLLMFLSGMANDTFTTWLKVSLVLFMSSFLGNAIGQWGSILAPPDTPFVGLVVVLLMVIPQFLFCGILILLDKIPVWWAWMAEITMFRYCLELLMMAQWRGYGSIPCEYLKAGDVKVEICPFPDGSAVLDFYGFGVSTTRCVLVILAW